MDKRSRYYYTWKVAHNPLFIDLLKSLIIKLIDIYQIKGGGKNFFYVECKFYPSCSEYTKQSIQHHGIIVGIYLGFQRIKRCDSDYINEIINDPIPRNEILLRSLFFSNELLEREEEDIRGLVRNLSESDRKVYFDALNLKLKDPDTYAALNFAFLGIHHLYLKKYITFILIFFFELFSLILFFSGNFILGSLLGILVFTHEVYHLFLSNQIVRNFNNRLSREILQSILFKIT